MEKSVVDLISSCLDSGNYKEALSASTNEKYANDLNNNCWDLITAVIGKIEDDTLILKPSLYGTCETLLSNIVKQCSPEEALFEFIEQIQVAKNNAQFAIVLDPVQQLLIKLSTKRFRSLEFTLDSMSTYISSIPLPEHQLEGKERLLMDSDVNIRRIIKIYSLLPPFYNPLIKEITLANANNTTKDILAAFLISLLGKPLIYVDLDPDCNANSEARICTSSIIQDICILVKNVNKLLDYVEFHHKQSLKPKSRNILTDNEEKLSPYDDKEKINMTTLSGLFYGIYSGHFEVPEYAVPAVYSISYVVHINLFCVLHLLSFAEYGPVAKGMGLCTKILNQYPTNTSHSVLKNSIHYSLIQSLVNIAIYSSYDTLRKEAVKLISNHINKFEYKGRCMLIKYILNNANHSGMIGYAITLYKNSIEDAFKESELPDCFTGPQLLGTIKNMCYLPHGAESDLVELADQIITALNFLRYLALKDNLNRTGIRECFTIIEDDYLKKLRTALNMSRAHYEVKLMDINNSKGLPEEQVDISINVGGNMLDKIPTESKKQIIHSALNAFHLIEGLVARLSECIVINKSQ
nr:glomulin-like isoform X1 [Vanessa tameamea]